MNAYGPRMAEAVGANYVSAFVRPAREGGRMSAPGMTSNQEVKVQTRGPTEGTRHRRDKGVGLEHQVL